jgi:hypothetical protein
MRRYVGLKGNESAAESTCLGEAVHEDTFNRKA